MPEEKDASITGNPTSIPGLVPLSPDSITAQDFIDQQTQLEEQARQLMPYDPQHCTFHDGSIRQQLFVCLTCQRKNNVTNAICYSCSIQCHSDHELVELFTKRGFSCDCGTERMKSFGGCNLRKNFDGLDRPEPTNVYGHNFEGRFCGCDKPYDPLREDGVMFQCLLGDACNEDWYHEECILGVPRGSIERKKSSKPNTAHPQGVNMFDSLEDAHSLNVERRDEIENIEEREEEEQTLTGLPNQSETGAFICWKCVEKNRKIMEKIANIGEISMKVLRIKEEECSAATGLKRVHEIEEQSSKKAKLDELPDQQVKQESTENVNNEPVKPSSSVTVNENSSFSIFLKPDYQEFFSKSEDPELIKMVEKWPFFAEEEESYEPPTDDDANSSLLDAGTRALHSLPREQAMNGLAAYEVIRSQLTNFLRPFAEKGKVVTEDDVNGFFDKMKEEQSRVHS